MKTRYNKLWKFMTDKSVSKGELCEVTGVRNKRAFAKTVFNKEDDRL